MEISAERSIEFHETSWDSALHIDMAGQKHDHTPWLHRMLLSSFI